MGVRVKQNAHLSKTFTAGCSSKGDDMSIIPALQFRRSISDGGKTSVKTQNDPDNDRIFLSDFKEKIYLQDKTKRRTGHCDINIGLTECQEKMGKIMSKLEMDSKHKLSEYLTKARCKVKKHEHMQDIANSIERIETKSKPQNEDFHDNNSFATLHKGLKMYVHYRDSYQTNNKTELIPREVLEDLLRIRVFPYSTPISFPMSDEMLRIASLSTFPRNIDISLIRLARAGFYLTDRGNETKCYSCGVTYNNWNSGDNPMVVHRHISPECDIVTQSVSSDNSSQRTNESRARNYSQETSTLNNRTIRPSNAMQNNNGQNATATHSSDQYNIRGLPSVGNNQQGISIGNNVTTNNSAGSTFNADGGTNDTGRCSSQDRSTQIETSETLSSNHNSNFSSLGINIEKPRYPNYASLPVRISSYQGWPSYLDQTPRAMGMSGFFYAGYNDYARCFFCGGGLRNWEAGDNPWVEHARWFPQCAFLKQNKGEEFIKTVLKKQQDMNDKQTGNTPQEGSSNTNTQSNCTEGYHSQMNSIAVRSVVEMGYSNEQIMSALQKINLSRQDDVDIKAVDILNVLLNDEAGSSTQGASGDVLSDDTRKSDQVQNEMTSLTIMDDEMESLMEENRQLRQQRLCKICLEVESTIAFLPCGDVVCCVDCAPAMRKCPVCRTHVKGTVKTYLA